IANAQTPVGATMTRTSLLAATAVAVLAISSLLVNDADARGPATGVGRTRSGFSASVGVRGYHPVAGGHFSRPAVTTFRPARVYSGALRLGSTKYKPVPGIG